MSLEVCTAYLVEVTFSKALSKPKAQSSNVICATFH